MSSSYCFRRNNHFFDLAEHFEKMFKDESMVDVTLSCGDGIIKAHKMILSACSSYFKNIFTKFNNPCQYPIIIKDMPFEDLRAIIEFIYRGEVTVAHYNLKSFLRSAESLKVKCLSDARRQMEGDESLALMRKKKRKRRRKSRKMGHGNFNKAGEMDDENGERNAGSTDRSGVDKGKDGNTTEDDDVTDYTEEEDDDDETEKEDDNTTTSIIITERETTGTEVDIEPARLLELSMITGDKAIDLAKRTTEEDKAQNYDGVPICEHGKILAAITSRMKQLELKVDDICKMLKIGVGVNCSDSEIKKGETSSGTAPNALNDDSGVEYSRTFGTGHEDDELLSLLNQITKFSNSIKQTLSQTNQTRTIHRSMIPRSVHHLQLQQQHQHHSHNPNQQNSISPATHHNHQPLPPDQLSDHHHHHHHQQQQKQHRHLAQPQPQPQQASSSRTRKNLSHSRRTDCPVSSTSFSALLFESNVENFLANLDLKVNTTS